MELASASASGRGLADAAAIAMMAMPRVLIKCMLGVVVVGGRFCCFDSMSRADVLIDGWRDGVEPSERSLYLCFQYLDSTVLSRQKKKICHSCSSQDSFLLVVVDVAAVRELIADRIKELHTVA